MTEVRNGKIRRKSGVGRVLPKKLPRKRGGQDLLDRFGLYLTRRRKAKNMSIREFAKSAKIAHTNVFQMECLRKNPRLTELELLAKAFREPLSKFLEPVL